MSAWETVMDAVRDRGMRVIARAGAARTSGPCHGGDAPDTVAISIGRDKRVLIHCHKGCSTEDFLAAVGLKIGDLYDEPKSKGGLGAVTKSYAYLNSDGAIRYYVDRYEPKSFRPRMADGSKGFPREHRLLYNLPQVRAEIQAGGIIWLCEGEKDADNLTVKARVVATTMPGGTGMGWQESYTDALMGAAQVVILADRDPDGQGVKHARKVAASLTRRGIPNRIMLPAVGKDITDHLAAGLGAADLAPLDAIENDEPLPPEPDAEEDEVGEVDIAEQKVSAMLAELLDTGDLDSIQNLETLVADMLFLDTLGRINGPSGHGKSFVALDFAGCVGTGVDWHGRRVRQGLVIYLVAEGARGIRKRVRAWEQRHGRKMTGVKFLPRPVQAVDIEWLILIEACRRIGPVLIIVDTQARVTVGVEENSNTEMGKVIDRMEQLRAKTGACVLLIHHKGLNGDHGRGASAVKGAMQTEMTVTKQGQAEDTRVILATDKQKDSEEIGKLTFSLKQVTLDGEAEEDGRPVTSAVLILSDAPEDNTPVIKLAPAALKLLAALNALGRPLPSKDVIDQVAKMHGTGLKRETGSRELNAMHKQGLVDRLTQLDGGVEWAITEKGRNHSQ